MGGEETERKGAGRAVAAAGGLGWRGGDGPGRMGNGRGGEKEDGSRTGAGRAEAAAGGEEAARKGARLEIGRAHV